MTAPDLEFIPLNEAARLLCCSRANLYRLERDGALRFAKLGGRTVVAIDTVRQLLRSAKPYKPATARTVAAVRARISRAPTSASL